DPVEFGEHRVLDLEVLHDGLDDKIHAFELFEARGHPDPAEDLVPRGGFELSALDRAVEAARDRCASELAELIADLADPRFVAGLRGHFGDPAAHETASENGDPADLRHVLAPGLRSTFDAR